MRLKTMTRLFAVSIVILTGSPALAARTASHDAYCRSCEQQAGPSPHMTFGTRVAPESNTPRLNGATHDDWPANMILG
jgi:hypothetical protein